MKKIYISRAAEKEIDRFIRERRPHKQVLLVEGARQVGKTSLVEHVIGNSGKESHIINLERDARMRALIDECAEFSELEELLRDRLGFDGTRGHVLFIDEAQESRRLGAFVRFMKEAWPKASVILSGSTLTRVFRSGVRYPVGRVQKIVVTPFSFSEFLTASGKAHLSREILTGGLAFSKSRHRLLLDLYDEFLETGGLPEVVLAACRQEDHGEVRAQIIGGYEADFIRIFGEERIDIVNACFRSVANFVGSVSKNSTVVPSPGTYLNARISDVFARLESWHLILRSDQRGPGPEGSHQYLPKRYLFDTGVLRHFREAAVPSIRLVDLSTTAVRIPLGGIVENQVAVELARFGDPIHGWKKTPSGNEIDFIVKREGRTYPVECKASLSIDRRHLRGVSDYLEMYSQPAGIIVSLGPYDVIEISKRRRIVNVPVYLLERLSSSRLKSILGGKR